LSIGRLASEKWPLEGIPDGQPVKFASVTITVKSEGGAIPSGQNTVRGKEFNKTLHGCRRRRSPGPQIDGEHCLDPKDRPILLAAIHGKAEYLLTGDARYFGHLYGKRIEGILVLRPAQYFERRRRR
jgi:hypothetical protein